MSKNERHTQEPWSYSPDKTEIFPITGPNSMIELARIVGPKSGSSHYSQGEADANTRRIAACVNGCEGVNPEAVKDLLAACRRVLVWFDDYQDSAFYDGYTCKEEYKMMQAAIAKAEAEKEAKNGILDKEQR